MLKGFFRNFDWILFLPAVLILTFGLVTLYSVSPENASFQLIFSLLGLAFYFGLSFINYRLIKPFSPLIFAVGVFMLILLLAAENFIRGAARWFVLGPFQFQPVEFVKIALIIITAFILSKSPKPIPFLKLLTSFLIVLFAAVLVFLQPSLGSALLIVLIWSGMVLVYGVRLFVIVGSFAALTIFLPLFWGFLKSYQRERILTFLNPYSDPLGAGYNVIQSIIAVGSGQVFGRGFGRGTQSHLKFLPERHTDFIFASLAEEWGLLGVVILLTLFLILLWRILAAGAKSKDVFGIFLCVGVFFMLLAEVVVNIGMNLGLLPVTGLPLPLVSYGGSSLIATFAALGLVQSVARHNRL